MGERHDNWIRKRNRYLIFEERCGGKKVNDV